MCYKLQTISYKRDKRHSSLVTCHSSLSLLSVFFLLLTISVSAQKNPYEFSIYGGGGYAAFAIQKPIIKPASKGFGVDAGVGFTYFFSENWGIHTGVGFGFSNVTNKISILKFITPEQEDCEGYLYDLHTALNNYSEKHKTMFVSLPLMIQYQTRMEPISHQKRDKKAGFYAMAGAKALFLVSNNYTTEITSLYNKAYYPEFDNWINSLPILWLGTFDGNSVNGKLKFNLLAMFALEAGIKWQVGKKLFLYTGAYFDIGLYDYTKKSRVPYSNFTTPEHLNELTLLDFAKRMNLMAVGIKVRVAFEGNKKMNSCNCR
jgi:hypothetical protein